MPTTTIIISDELREAVNLLIRRGFYSSLADAVRDGLRRVLDHHAAGPTPKPAPRARVPYSGPIQPVAYLPVELPPMRAAPTKAAMDAQTEAARAALAPFAARGEAGWDQDEALHWRDTFPLAYHDVLLLDFPALQQPKTTKAHD